MNGVKRVGVRALQITHLDQQLTQRRVLARQPVGEIGIRHDRQQAVAHAVVSADLLFEQVVHRLTSMADAPNLRKRGTLAEPAV
jgi:hypothetical protein